MKDVLLSNAGVQVYIIDGSRRTDAAARAVITALYNAGRVCKEAAERAWSDRATLDKIKRNMLHVQMEERETETGKRWTFYAAGCVYMDIPAYSRNYIRADKNGLLYSNQDAQNAPTAEEPEQDKEITADDGNEPQNATETAQKTTDRTTDMETFKKAYSAAYSHLYDHANTPAAKAKSRIYSALFDEQWEQIKNIAKAFCKITGDLLTSDREAAAFMIALETVGAPTDEVTATEGNATTTTETKPQQATQTAEKTIRTGERLYSHPHRHMVIVEGLQGDLVRVIYRGRLYLVCCGDLYTDETETTPAILPTEPEESTQPAAVIPIENDTTSTTKATQEGTESATATTGRECTQEAAQDAQNAHRATEAYRPIQGHTAPHKRPYRATQRAAKSIMRHSPTTATGRRPEEKSHFLAGMGSAKILDQGDHPPPILKHFSDRFLKRFLSGQKSAGGTGVKNLLQILERKFFKKILKGR